MKLVLWLGLAALLQAPAQTPAQIKAAAFDIMRAARYCTLITNGGDGQPQARMVDPLIAEDEGAIWIATNPLTRKVTEIKRDARVTLMFFNAAEGEYVTVFAKAAIVTDASRRAAHWKTEWQPFYKGGVNGDVTLFEVKPFRLEVSSQRHGLNNDPKTWRPVILDLGARKP